MKSNSIIARTARLESASDLIWTEKGRLANRIIRLERAKDPDLQLIQQLEIRLRALTMEYRKLSLDDDDYTLAVIAKYGRNPVVKLRVDSNSPSSSGQPTDF